MKKLISALVLTLSFNYVALASTYDIIIPVPRSQGRYYGSAEEQVRVLKRKLLEKAVSLCGSEEKITMIHDVELSISLDTIALESLAESSLSGSYPLSGLTAKLNCKD